MTQSGYTPCKCRDCMEIAISNDVTNPDYCNACEGECGPENTLSSECQAEGAYGINDSVFECEECGLDLDLDEQSNREWICKNCYSVPKNLPIQ